MATIDTIIQRNGLKYYIKLSPYKSMNPFTRAALSKWNGYINNDKISFTQIRGGGYSEYSFDFSNLQQEYQFLTEDIIELIDKAMRIMD